MNRFSKGAGARRSFRPCLERLETRDVPTALQVAFGIIHSTENLNNFVAFEYQTYLRRPATSDDVNTWVQRIQAGLAPEIVEASIVASTEYIFDNGNTESGWVTGLYRDLLGRVPSQNEVNIWVGALNRGETASHVAAAFSTGVERDSIVVALDYSTYLGRLASTSEINSWVNAMQRGLDRATLTVEFVGSPEYFQLNGSNATSYVKAVYRDILGRAPNTSELNAWVQIFNQP